MIRSTVLAVALAAGLTFPALAADTAANNIFTQDQARQHLMHLGYTNISELQKDAHGNWAGIAMKDGKTLPVAVGVKAPATDAN
jgi:hypothetical protein